MFTIYSSTLCILFPRVALHGCNQWRTTIQSSRRNGWAAKQPGHPPTTTRWRTRWRSPAETTRWTGKSWPNPVDRPWGVCGAWHPTIRSGMVTTRSSRWTRSHPRYRWCKGWFANLRRGQYLLPFCSGRCMRPGAIYFLILDTTRLDMVLSFAK